MYNTFKIEKEIGGIRFLKIDERTMEDLLDESHPVDTEAIANLLHLTQFDDEDEFQSYQQKN